MSLSEEIRNEFRKTCIVNKIERPECTLCLSGTPEPYLIIDLDLRGSPLGPNVKRCDFLVFVDNVGEMPCAAPVEFKFTLRGTIVEQLQAGAKELEWRIPVKLECLFRPIGVVSNLPKNQRKRIRQRVSFRGQDVPIRILYCGDKLIQALCLTNESSA